MTWVTLGILMALALTIGWITTSPQTGAVLAGATGAAFVLIRRLVLLARPKKRAGRAKPRQHGSGNRRS